MNMLYTHNHRLKKKIKVLYFSPKIWRSMVEIAHTPVYIYAEKRINGRSSSVPATYLYTDTTIHTGNKWVTQYVNKWMFGFKLGSFTWNRKYAIYKAKAKRKKLKGKKK